MAPNPILRIGIAILLTVEGFCAPAAGAPALMRASHQALPPVEQSGLEEMDEAFRVYALNRIDRMLSTIAARFDTQLGPDFMVRLYTPGTAEATRHIYRAQQEFRRLQKLACKAGSMPDTLCRMPNFQYSAMMRDDADALRAEIDRTLYVVRAFWMEICRRPSSDGSRCTVE